METLYQIPDVFSAGSTVKYTRRYSDYPASQGWTLTLYLAGGSGAGSKLTKVGVASGDEFTFTLASADTDDLLPGTYTWIEVATKSGDRFDAGAGKAQVLPDPVASAATTYQTFEEKQLVVVEAAINKRLTADQESFQIDGVAVSKIPIEKLFEIRRGLITAINAQRNPGQFGVRVQAKFVRS